MASVHDVAAYILRKTGRVTTMKLQKLVYYCQAWHLVWDEKPLFRDKIRAWANGPVVYQLFQAHRGEFDVRKWPKGKSSRLNKDEIATIDAVLDLYGDKTSQWLSDLSHQEAPWQMARRRGNLAPGERGSEEVQRIDMFNYYSDVQSRHSC